MKLAAHRLSEDRVVKVEFAKDIPSNDLTYAYRCEDGVLRCAKCGEIYEPAELQCLYCKRVVINALGLSPYLRKSSEVKTTS